MAMSHYVTELLKNTPYVLRYLIRAIELLNYQKTNMSTEWMSTILHMTIFY